MFPSTIIQVKREKFRVELRRQSLEREFRQKRLLGPQVDTPLSEAFYSTLQLMLVGGGADQQIDEMLSQLHNSEQHLKPLLTLALHLQLVELLSRTPLPTLQCNLLRCLANMMFYSDQAIIDLQGLTTQDVFLLLVRLACQNEHINVSDCSLSALANYVVGGQGGRVLQTWAFFQFWVDYLEQDQNDDCVARRYPKLIFMLLNLLDVPDALYTDYVGCLVIIKLIVPRLTFAGSTVESCCDTLYLLRGVLKRGTPLDIAEVFQDELYSTLVEVVKVSEGHYEHLSEARVEAAKTLKTLSGKLGSQYKLQLYNMGLRNTLRDLLREPSTINLGLKLLRHLFTGEQLVDVEIFDQHPTLLQELLQLLHQDNYVGMTLKTLSLAVEFGSHQIYNQFIHEGFLHKLVPILVVSNVHCGLVLDIISCCLQKDDSIYDLQQKYYHQISSKLLQENIVAVLEALSVRTRDGEVEQKCNDLLQLINEGGFST